MLALVACFYALVLGVRAQKACEAEWCDPGHQPYPNIVSVLTGYNILKGNPFSSGHTHDPGFSTEYIFVPTIRDQDKKYVLHSGITVRETQRCQLTLNTQTVTTLKGYRDRISKKTSSGQQFASGVESEVSVELEGVGVSTTVPPLLDMSFSSSEDYKNNKEFFTQQKGVLTFNEATCSVYTVRISSFDPPDFTPAFKEAAKLLSRAESDNDKKIAFDRFIRAFGTHFLKQSTMGARTAISRRYSQDEYKNTNDNAIKECNSHRFQINLFTGPGGGASKSSCEAVASTANDAEVLGVIREYVTSYGSRPGENLVEWSKQDFNAPLPIKMELSPVLNLFTQAHWKDEPDVDVKKILRWFGPKYYSYCEDNKDELGLDKCEMEKEKCGIDDTCVPAQQFCNNKPGRGYECCTPPCSSSPCQHGGVCTDQVEGKCDFICNCEDGWKGKTCGTKYVVKEILLKEVRENMRSNAGKSNDDYRGVLYSFLTSTYHDYYFNVASYGQASGFDNHAVNGWGYVHVFREFGRNVVVGWARKTSYLPPAQTMDYINQAAVAAVLNKGCDARGSMDKAYKVVSKYSWPVVKVMVVRFGNNLRNSKANSATTRFTNFQCRGGGHKSSLIIMWGET